MLTDNGIVQSRLLAEHGIIHGMSTKIWGNMSFDRSQQGRAPQNLEKLTAKLGIDMHKNSLAVIGVNNTATVALISQPEIKGRVIISQSSQGVEIIHPQQETVGIDAAICQQDNVFLAILPADCPPIMIYDPTTRTFALIHGSTISLSKQIVFQTLICLQKWLKVKLKDLICYIGPGICSHCYSYKLDLASIAAKELLYFGIPEENIETSNLCTFHDESMFFSNHRAKNKKNEGRQIAIIGKKGK